MSERRIDENTVQTVLDEIKDPESGRSVTESKQVRQIRIDGDSVTVTLALTTHSAPLWEETRKAAEQLLTERLPGLNSVAVELTVHERPPQKIGQIGLAVKSLIAVGSGKGGVGKSTISANIALGLSRSGAKVGLLDADVYGPSIPHLLGITGPVEQENGQLLPIDKDGLSVMSIAFLVPPGEAVVWRGPMLHHAMTNFLRDTRWGELDYLIVDMPPGTGDIALSLSQMLPVTGAVMVCTPQELALLDAVKAIGMLRKVNIPVLGMVENMSGFVCPDCNKQYDIFGRGGARARAKELEVPFLGEVPIRMHIRSSGDEGQTASVWDDQIVAPALEQICYRLVKNLAEASKADPPLPTLTVL